MAVIVLGGTQRMSDIPGTGEDDNAPVEGDAAPRHVGTGLAIWYSLANIGYGAFYAFNNFLLPPFIAMFTGNAIIQGLMGGTYSIEGMVIQPVVGALSDKSRSPWGRRRPFMLIATLISAVLLVVTPAAAALPPAVRMGGIILCIFLFTVAFNVANDPYMALMPDITPEEERGRVNGTAVLFNNLAQAGILVAAGVLVKMKLLFPGAFLLVAGLMVVTTLLTCWQVREPKAAGPVHVRNFREETRRAWNGLKILRQAKIALLVFAVASAGIYAVTPYLTLFVKTITHARDDSNGIIAALVLMVSTALGVAPFGWLTDKIGAKWVTLIGCAILGAACVGALWVVTMPQIIVILVIAGIGNGAYQGASYPLLTELVPREEVGLYTGFLSTARSLAQPATTVLTGELINNGHGSYRVIFAVCAVTMFVSMAILPRVRVAQAIDEIAAHRRADGDAEAGP
jgi:maltose/moltooligosaccharide transporter